MSLKIDKLDWKFATATMLAIIAIVSPFLLWKADLDAKKIDMTLLGSFELISSISESQQGLRILFDGKDLKDPFSSIIALSNSGAKPIQASDFEGPIKITVAKPAGILRSQIVRREPQSLEPFVFTNNRMITINPMLLNPGDRISVEILTTGGKPQFASRGRIAGVPDLKIQESQSEARLVKEVFGSSFVLKPAVAYILILIGAFGMSYTLFAGAIAAARGDHSMLTLVLGIFSNTIISSFWTHFLARYWLGISNSIERLALIYAALGVGVLVYHVTLRLFPPDRR